jgi:catechol 2,3-dioxygenase-like lactoylglutathione lyase family enzyme
MVGTRMVHVGIRATELERSLRFWRDVLDLRLVSTMAYTYDLTDGYHNFRLFQHDGTPRPAHVSGMLDYLHIGVLVDDLGVALRRCTDAGCTIVWDGVDAGQPYDPNSPPTQSFKVADPDGIVVDVSASDDQWPGVTRR